jgi:hypothetical protein
MCVPVRVADQAVGVLSIQSYTPDAYTQDDLHRRQSLADHCGGALDRLPKEKKPHDSRASSARTATSRTGQLKRPNLAGDLPSVGLSVRSSLVNTHILPRLATLPGVRWHPGHSSPHVYSSG